MTPQDKLILLLTMIEASREVFNVAGVTSFAGIEQYANDLELAGETDISAVTESDIYQLYVMIEALVFFPSMQNIARYWRDLQGAITIVPVGPQSVYLRGVDGALEFSFDGELWKSSFPPAAHTHTVSEIPDFPATMPPAAHDHVIADVTDFPATMPPEAHDHVIADLTDWNSAKFERIDYVGDGIFPRSFNLDGITQRIDLLLLLTSGSFLSSLTDTAGEWLNVSAGIVITERYTFVPGNPGVLTLPTTSGNGGNNAYALLIWGQ